MHVLPLLGMLFKKFLQVLGGGFCRALVRSSGTLPYVVGPRYLFRFGVDKLYSCGLCSLNPCTVGEEASSHFSEPVLSSFDSTALVNTKVAFSLS